MKVVAWPAFSNAKTNPYNSLLYHAMQDSGVEVQELQPAKFLAGEAADVLHVHWPESLLNIRAPALALAKTLALLGLIGAAKGRGTRIVWTVHNLAAHDRHHPRLERWFWARFLPCLDGWISLSHAGAQMARERFPQLAALPCQVIPHGHYRDRFAAPVAQSAARRRLGLAPDAKVLAFVGQIRPYKNVPHLVEAFARLGGPQYRLLIAGAPRDAELKDAVARAAAGDDRITAKLHFLAEPELAETVAASDVVVLPYREILNSGSALLALSLNRPVLVPDLGAFGELRAEVGSRWVLTYPGRLQPEALAAALAVRHDPSSVAPLEKLNWDTLAAATVDFYRQLRPAAEHTVQRPSPPPRKR